MTSILYYVSLALLLLSLVIACTKPSEQTGICPENPAFHLTDKMCGMSLVAPPDPLNHDPMPEMTALGIDWVAILPYGNFDTTLSKVILEECIYGCWGETAVGVAETYRLARAEGLNVMIKPQLWSWQQWIGDLDMQDAAGWKRFHESYTQFICAWADVADSLGAEVFCIGTEIKQSTMYFPDYWNDLIDTIRQHFSGKITYAANWDEYDQITFWDKLDYIGVDAYFSLQNEKTPRICELMEFWKPIAAQLETFSNQWNKPIVFTEWGYLSLDACTYQTWELEKERWRGRVNEVAQSNAMHALLATFGKKSWWKGGFQWKWYTDLNTAGVDRSNDYTPQGKIAEDCLKAFYLP